MLKNPKVYRAVFLFLIILIILGIFGFVSKKQSTAQVSQTAATVTMLMKQDSFEPADIKIKKGTTVIFENPDVISHWPASNLHPTHELYPEFDPKQPIEPGKQWSFTFDKVGKWGYHDHLFPATRGTIEVYE